MNGPASSLIHEMRPGIIERRVRLQAASGTLPADYVHDLLAEIDAALQKIDNGSFGLCETCHDPIEEDRLRRNPLTRFCLDHLTREERKAHEQDLELATHIQASLLPKREVTAGLWEAHYRYEPAGIVGGDYCEILASEDGQSLFFALGDIAGKGVAASLLMTHLSAIVRSLVSLDLPLAELMSRANRLLCESTPATHYATLAAGRTSDSGIEVCNAGHCRPLLLRQNGTEWIDATGLPLGLFCDGKYTVTHVPLDPGDRLVLYSDGVTETPDSNGNVFDEERLVNCLHAHRERDLISVAGAVLQELKHFRNSDRPQDDVTLLLLRRR
jgi:sigma-B regulation protein RsbU (phosphoserine phosphatase)